MSYETIIRFVSIFTVVSILLGMNWHSAILRGSHGPQTRGRGMLREIEAAAHYGRGLEASVPRDPASSSTHSQDRAGREVIARASWK